MQKMINAARVGMPRANVPNLDHPDVVLAETLAEAEESAKRSTGEISETQSKYLPSLMVTPLAPNASNSAKESYHQQIKKQRQLLELRYQGVRLVSTVAKYTRHGWWKNLRL